MKRWIAALAVLVAVAAAAAQDDPKKAEKEAEARAKARVEEFKSKYAKCKTDDERVTVIDGLADDQHPVVLDQLKSMMGKGSIDIRVEVADELGKFRKNEKVAKMLLAAARAEKEPEVAAKYLAEVGDIGCRAVAADLAAFYRLKVAPSREAVNSSGKLRSKNAIDPLILLLADLEREQEELARNPGGGPGGPGAPGGPGGPAPDPGGTPGGRSDDEEKKKRIQEVLPKTVQALKDITGEKHVTSKDWAKWWAKNKSTFKEYAEE